MSYVTITEVRNTIGVSSDDISNDVINQAIDFASDELDRLTFTQYLPVEDSGTATASTSSTIEDTDQSWVSNQWDGFMVYIYSGTGNGQVRTISSNTSDTITIAIDWSTNPDTTSKYMITYDTTVTDTIDGNGTNNMILENTPVIQLDSLTIDGTSINTDNVNLYKDTGKLILDDSAAKTEFTSPTGNSDYQAVTVTYKYGVLPKLKRGKLQIEGYIKRLITIIAGLQSLAYQVGGTYDDLATFSISGISGSLGQPYINIKSLIDRLDKEKQEILNNTIAKQAFMA